MKDYLLSNGRSALLIIALLGITVGCTLPVSATTYIVSAKDEYCLFSESIDFLDAKSAGMGGAGIAMVDGNSIVQVNPAKMAFQDGVGLTGSLGYDGSFTIAGELFFPKVLPRLSLGVSYVNQNYSANEYSYSSSESAPTYALSYHNESGAIGFAYKPYKREVSYEYMASSFGETKGGGQKLVLGCISKISDNLTLGYVYYDSGETYLSSDWPEYHSFWQTKNTVVGLCYNTGQLMGAIDLVNIIGPSSASKQVKCGVQVAMRENFPCRLGLRLDGRFQLSAVTFGAGIKLFCLPKIDFAFVHEPIATNNTVILGTAYFF